MCLLMTQLLHGNLARSFFNNKIAFVNFTRNFFLNKYPIFFPPDQVVIEVLEDIPVDSALVQSLKRFSDQGFKSPLMMLIH